MADDIVFPAAGFMAMAIEAIYQSSVALSTLEGEAKVGRPRYRLRDITFPKALVLEEKSDGRQVMLSLTKVPGGSWHEFKIYSLSGEAWLENSRGLVQMEEDFQSSKHFSILQICTPVLKPNIVAPETALRPLEYAAPGKLWYKAMHDAGYNFGPCFQKHLEAEAISGKRQSRSIVSLTPPDSEYGQSSYPLHPACIDACLQTCAPSLWSGNRASINAVLIPAIIDEIVVSSNETIPEKAISVTASKYVGLGRQEETKNYASSASVYDPDNGSLLFQLSGLRYHQLETRSSPYDAHAYSRVLWRSDITHLSQQALLDITSEAVGPKHTIQGDPAWRATSEIVDLVLHKKPDAKVIEFSAVPGDMSSVWLDGSVSDKAIRAACREFHFVTNDAKALLATQERYGTTAEATYGMLDMTKSPEDFEANGTDFDLAIVRVVGSCPDLTDY